MVNANTYQRIVSLCQGKIDENSGEVVGDLLDESLAGQVALDQTELMHTELGPVEINATRELARPPFEWLYEITFRGDGFEHYLVMPDGEIVETYGKKVMPVDDTKAETLLKNLQQL